MSLQKYRQKRDFKKSHEPQGHKVPSSNVLNFCVQKHNASHLHYDFRLEYHGVLLSWAVPKGPSLDPRNKRLAIKVEDHPLEYQYFEGVIPKGNYGAGTVEIWDHGTYTFPHSKTRQEAEKNIAQGLKKGHLPIILDGKKLKGAFVLQKLKSDPDDNSWLLIKKEQSTDKTENSIAIRQKPSKKTSMPKFVSPMLATLIDAPFSDEDWIFEIKWDGYRALAFIDEGEVNLQSRTKHSWNKQFPIIIDTLKKIKGQVILDGELVVLDEEGKPQFQLMQNYPKQGEGSLYYYVFDILYQDGVDLKNLPLIERKEILKKFLNKYSLPLICLSESVAKDGKPLFQQCVKNHLEGIIGKKISSIYESKRSHDWVKIKTKMQQEVVIGGFTSPQGARQKFGALLVGVYNEKGELNYVGHVGGGFNSSLLQNVYQKLTPLIQKKCPFKNVPKTNASATWVNPRQICEVSFSEWTKDNQMRQPIFHGIRTDKLATNIKKEMAEKMPEKNLKETKLKPKIAGLSLTHLDKIYWKEENYTKEDLIGYYTSIAPFILPYLKNRPIMLHRFPNGIEGKYFYQKDINFSHPDWIKTYSVQHEGSIDHYIGINDLRSLLYAVNLGSIDLHPFTSSYQTLEKPDFCVIDFDPHDIDFEKVIETVLMTHEILEEIGVKHFCKTSGGKGLHVVIPFNGKYDFEQSRQFAEIIATYIHNKLPEITSLERSPQKRPKKIYLDCLQNRFGQTLVAPYAVRPRPGALVSTPLLWEEVSKHLNVATYNIKTVPHRVKEKGDAFKGVLGAAVNLKSALQKISRYA